MQDLRKRLDAERSQKEQFAKQLTAVRGEVAAAAESAQEDALVAQQQVKHLLLRQAVLNSGASCKALSLPWFQLYSLGQPLCNCGTVVWYSTKIKYFLAHEPCQVYCFASLACLRQT